MQVGAFHALLYCATVTLDDAMPIVIRQSGSRAHYQRAGRATNEEPGMTQLKKHPQTDRFFSSESALHAVALESPSEVSPDL